jgi:hypothetical protein
MMLLSTCACFCVWCGALLNFIFFPLCVRHLYFLVRIHVIRKFSTGIIPTKRKKKPTWSKC